MKNKGVIIWLLSGCFLLLIMVCVGCITRLTNSGLSMTDWHLVTDTFPPLSEEKWEEAFTEYQKFPEYQKINKFKNFTLEDYKSIYFWEWFHRFIARFISIVFIIPFTYFLIKKKLSAPIIKQCLLLFFMGALQAVFGWYMVKSGLKDRPDVSHFWLSLHLITAFITSALTFYTALNVIYPERRKPILPLKKITQILLAFLIFQIIYGGFVAGLDAGKLHNTWPMMNEGQFIHDSVLIEQKTLFLNLTEGKSGVQFVHRSMAYVVFGLIIFLYFKSKKYILDSTQQKAIKLTLVLVCIQFAFGVFTLLYSVPLSLGLLHQIGAFFLLSAVTFTLHRLSK